MKGRSCLESIWLRTSEKSAWNLPISSSDLPAARRSASAWGVCVGGRAGGWVGTARQETKAARAQREVGCLALPRKKKAKSSKRSRAPAHLWPVVLHLEEGHHLGGVQREALLHALLALPALAVRLALDEHLARLARAVPPRIGDGAGMRGATSVGLHQRGRARSVPCGGRGVAPAAPPPSRAVEANHLMRTAMAPGFLSRRPW